MHDDGFGKDFKIPLILAMVVVIIMVSAVLPGISFGINGGNNWNILSASQYLSDRGYFVWAAGGLESGSVPVATASNTLATDGSSFAYNFGTDTLSVDNLDAPTGRTATYVIAASDATALEKAQADVVCTGVSTLSATIANGMVGRISSPGVWTSGGAKTVTTAGDLTVTLAVGQSGYCWSGTSMVTNNNGQPVSLVAGANTINVLGTGTIYIGGMGDEISINSVIQSIKRLIADEPNATGEISFSSGLFITWDSINFYGGTTFKGTGMASSFIRLRSPTNMFKWVGGASAKEYFCKWEDLRMTGPTQAASALRARAIYAPQNGAYYLRDSRIVRCYIEYFGDYSIYIAYAGGWEINQSVLEHNWGGAIYSLGGGLFISDCKIALGGIDGVSWVDDFVYLNGPDNIITGVQFVNMGRRLIWLNAAPDTKFTGCSFTGASGDNYGMWECVYISSTYRVIFSGCTFDGYNSIKAANTASCAIKIANDGYATDIIISGGSIINMLGQAIVDGTGKAVKISNVAGVQSVSRGNASIPKDSSTTAVTVTHSLTSLPSISTCTVYSWDNYISDGTGTASVTNFILQPYNKIYYDVTGSVVVTMGTGVYGIAVGTGLTGSPVQLSSGSPVSLSLSISGSVHTFEIYCTMNSTSVNSYLTTPSSGTTVTNYTKRPLYLGANVITITGPGTFSVVAGAGVTGFYTGAGSTPGNLSVTSRTTIITTTTTGTLTITLANNSFYSIGVSPNETAAGTPWVDTKTITTFNINIPSSVATSSINPIESAFGSVGTTTASTGQLAATINATVNDIKLMGATPGNTAALYLVGTEQYYGIKIKQTTAGVKGTGSWTITPQYWNGSAWSVLSGVVDNTVEWTVIDAASGLDITWTIPTNWKSDGLMGAFGYSVRFLVSSYTTPTTIPLADQIWLLDALHFDWIATYSNQN